MKSIILSLCIALAALNLFAEEAGLLEGDLLQAHELLKTEWLVAQIQGEPLVEGSRTEFSFFEPGRIAATVGCNRIGGAVAAGDGTLKFGPLMMTRMACEEALMDQENRFSEALSLVSHYRLNENGGVLLLLDDEDTILVRLVKPKALDDLVE